MPQEPMHRFPHKVPHRCLHIRILEHASRQLDDVQCKVNHAHAPLAFSRSIEDGALEMGIVARVECTSVIQDDGEGLVGIESAELNVRRGAFVKVTVVCSDAKTWWSGQREHTGRFHNIPLDTLTLATTLKPWNRPIVLRICESMTSRSLSPSYLGWK